MTLQKIKGLRVRGSTEHGCRKCSQKMRLTGFKVAGFQWTLSVREMEFSCLHARYRRVSRPAVTTPPPLMPGCIALAR